MAATRPGLLALSCAIPLLLSCAGQSVYVPPGQTTQMGADFSDTDMRIMAQAMYNSLQSRLAQIRGSDQSSPVVALIHIKNMTSEHIQADVMTDKLQIGMMKAGSLRFVDRSMIQASSAEWDMGGAGMMDQETTKRAGRVLGADYLIYGEVSGIKRSEGRTQMNYYRLSLKMIDVETNELAWADEHEIKKMAKKGALSW